MADKKNYFEELNKVDCKDKIEKKNGLSYLSWAWAWGELKKRYPLSSYTIYENNDGWNYFTDGKTAWVKTGVTVVFEDGTNLEHIEYLPVMDFKNKSIPVDNITSFDVNKTIQRSLTKAVARHGVGLYIYAGEDIPEDDNTKQPKSESKPAKEAEEVASETMKKTFQDVCKAMNVNPAEIIKEAGWKSGPVTKTQLGLANEILAKISNGNQTIS